MAIHSGFFNSVGSDRKYDAEDINKFFTGVITDGVLSTIGDTLFVVESAGMQVAIGSGKAWFLNSWIENTSDAFRTLSDSDVTYDRIDIIALDFDKSDQVRENDIIIVEGTPASSPVPPTLLDTGTHLQKPLAHILVGVGVTVIYNADITIKVDTVDCPFSSGITDLIVSVDDVTIEIVGNDLQVKDLGVDTAQLAADAVTGAKIENDAINSEHYANGSIDTAHLANNAVDDTKVGNRVPMLTRRQGGDPNSWEDSGETDYTPTTVKFQPGAVYLGACAQLSQITKTVTFPQVFSQPPIVFVTNKDGQVGEIFFWVKDITTADFDIVAKNVHPTASELVYANWIAIGEE